MESSASGITNCFFKDFEKEAKSGSIRPGDKSPTNWSMIHRGHAAILSLEWIVDG
jgi:hypothetical protein